MTIAAVLAAYVVGIFAVVLGGYAVVAVIAAIMQLGTIRSAGDLGILVLYVAIALFILALCAGGLWLAWRLVRPPVRRLLIRLNRA